ncbi:hypothetical protein QR680_002857 [Steinernema hermaphroditum]|uniref:Protein kinase domain-containing protein n=1 Tax=Steinernema hermaphroditum TaxID=289476 RepID=A0AA39LJ66_9BILA|nr:hypothetical protein QR680_002857 [Steinernema hermaphroditum]
MSSVSESSDGDLICGRWKVDGEIGRGGCGVVYQVSAKVLEHVDGVMTERITRAAMKCERIDPEDRYSDTLRSEVTVLRRMQRSDHVCRLYAAGRLSASVNILIMSLVGPSLSFMRRLCKNQRFSTSTAIRVAFQCLEAIQELHFIGYIHRDIKAGNFAIGMYPDDIRRIFLLDFGFARPYLKKGYDGKMRYRAPRIPATFRGTYGYCSMNSAAGGEQGRRDDLWSWMFMLVEFIEGKLPWKNCGGKAAELNREKRRALDTLLDRCPRQLYRIFDHIQALKYADRPNYAMMLGTLREIWLRRVSHEDPALDWEEGGRCHEQYLEAELSRPQMKKLDVRQDDDAVLNSECDYFSDNMPRSKRTNSYPGTTSCPVPQKLRRRFRHLRSRCHQLPCPSEAQKTLPPPQIQAPLAALSPTSSEHAFATSDPGATGCPVP